jgi:hypothetical protein
MGTFRLALKFRWRFYWGLALACAAACPASASGLPLIAPLPPKQAVAIVGKGIVWFDNGTLLFQSFTGRESTLGWVGPEARRRLPHMVASASGVAALLTREAFADRTQPRFIGGVPPHSLTSIPQPQPVSGGGCQRWVPATEASIGDFVVAGDDLVTAAQCERQVLLGTQTEVVNLGALESQPIFVRSLRGGNWRVLRWLPGDSPPILAAAGNRLAIGIQFSLAWMEVSVIDVRSGQTQSHFGVPDGYLSFASRERLVLSTPGSASPEFSAFPLGPQLRLGQSITGDGNIWKSYNLSLYSSRGRHLANLGATQNLPLVSKMHIVTLDYAEGGQSALSVRSLTAGAPRRVIGFSGPRRSLVTLAFRWPALALIETTSAPLSQTEFTCFTSEYKPPSSPFVQIFDLAHPQPFLPPPPAPQLVRPPRGACGPAPPVVFAARAHRR